MNNCVVYVHGKGGNIAESEHYKKLFADHDIIGLGYQSSLPWKAGKEIRLAVERLKERYENIVLVANSIGAYFSLHAHIDNLLEEAYFISPIVDMENLIKGLMARVNVTEKELREKKVISTPFGEDLSWEYLCFVRNNPIAWSAPTHVLYGSEDTITSYAKIRDFCEKFGATLTVMDGGEHWFHTDKQMAFLDEWIDNARRKKWVG